MIRFRTLRVAVAGGPRMPASGRWLVAGLVCLLLSRAEGQGPTNVNMVVTNNATVEWIWGTQFMFTATAAGNGAVGGDSNGWYDLGTNVEVVAEPARYHHFVSWSGDVPPESGTGAVLRLSLDQPRTVAAFFAENLATNGTPEWWLAQFGWTNDFNAAETNDADHDGLLNWQEWIAGTDPTNFLSVLSVTNLFPSASGFIIYWPSVSNRMYMVDRATNLILPAFEVIATNLAATPPVNVHTDQVMGTDKAFYRIKVERE